MKKSFVKLTFFIGEILSAASLFLYPKQVYAELQWCALSGGGDNHCLNDYNLDLVAGVKHG